jgi:ligand-binding sensor domain-containing protein
LVAGRITGLAVGNGAIYAGGADGGVFRSRDGGSTWTPLTDKLPTLSVGDVKLGPDGALWLATGEGNTGSTAYVGSGVYRVTSPLTDVFTTATRVGGAELESTFIHRLQFDDAGAVYAATSRGLWKHAATTNTGGWRRVLYPVADPVVGGVARPDL